MDISNLSTVYLLAQLRQHLESHEGRTGSNPSRGELQRINPSWEIGTRRVCSCFASTTLLRWVLTASSRPGPYLLTGLLKADGTIRYGCSNVRQASRLSRALPPASNGGYRVCMTNSTLKPTKARRRRTTIPCWTSSSPKLDRAWHAALRPASAGAAPATSCRPRRPKRRRTSDSVRNALCPASLEPRPSSLVDTPQRNLIPSSTGIQ